MSTNMQVEVCKTTGCGTRYAEFSNNEQPQSVHQVMSGLIRTC